MAPKHKTRVEVAIPEKFREFMKTVTHQIEVGDEKAIIESDDLLQCDFAYGGLYDAEQKLYGFRLFPELDDGADWDFSLQEANIRAIADGHLTSVSLWQCSNSKCKCLHASEDSYCPNCDNVLDFCDVEGDLRRFHPDSPNDVIKCMAHLRRIAFAINDYNSATGHFPPPYTTDEKGKPLHSWRTLILPHLDQESLFNRVVLDEPWDSPQNRELWYAMPHVYRCGKQVEATSTTGFVAVTGPETMWPTAESRRIADIKAGSSYVVLLIEQSDCRTIWMNPLDRPYADMFCGQENDSLSSGHVDDKSIAVFVDGHIESMSTAMEPEKLQRPLKIR